MIFHTVERWNSPTDSYLGIDKPKKVFKVVCLCMIQDCLFSSIDVIVSALFSFIVSYCLNFNYNNNNLSHQDCK